MVLSGRLSGTLALIDELGLFGLKEKWNLLTGAVSYSIHTKQTHVLEQSSSL